MITLVVKIVEVPEQGMNFLFPMPEEHEPTELERQAHNKLVRYIRDTLYLFGGKQGEFL